MDDEFKKDLKAFKHAGKAKHFKHSKRALKDLDALIEGDDDLDEPLDGESDAGDDLDSDDDDLDREI